MEISIGKTFSAGENQTAVKKIWDEMGLYSQWVSGSNSSEGQFRFVDGPPFVSSDNLHMGHILISMMKSTVLMYKRQQGHSLQNRMGYDTHGLPIEMAVNKELGLETPKDIQDYGIERYIEHCKDTINRFSTSWNPVFDKIGRLFDQQDQYKTMDTPFMESVWWAFSELHRKGLVYRGTRVMPYSVACGTPLSNFEAGQNYKEVEDMTAYVAFKMEEFYNTYLVAWTTTPWTLPANMALCVNPELTYETVVVDGTYYILAKETASKIWKEFTIKNETLGAKLIGHTYLPLFPCEELSGHRFRIIGDTFVQPSNPKEPGTSIVHIAPGFGEEDMRVCMANGIKTPFVPVDEAGKYQISTPELNGKFYRDMNKPILTMLADVVVKRQPYRHNYPFCWRTDTPLIYRAMDAWFVSVEKIKSELITNNSKTNWFPKHVGEGRFGQWLEGARDWCVSRNRFFGTPLPIWQNVCDPADIIVVGSVAELEELTSAQITDIHLDRVDGLGIIKDGKMYSRVSEVFDCWFESGCVPFAQHHYPFENGQMFDGVDYLCDFICEGIDQTRGWFYTLNILSTALFGVPAARDIACGGLILAADGRKISKRLGNFIPPMELLDKYGADLMRLYILKLPATYGESSRFCEGDIVKETKVVMQWINAVKFAAEHIRMFREITGEEFTIQLQTLDDENANDFDTWILQRLEETHSQINEHMKNYEMAKCVSILFSYIEDLTNWYLKFNRARLKGKEGVSIWRSSLTYLVKAIRGFNLISAPFMPFLAEGIAHNIGEWNVGYDSESVLLDSFTPNNNGDKDITGCFSLFQGVCETVRNLRNKAGLSSVRIPIKQVNLVCGKQNSYDNLLKMREYFRVEMNIIETDIQLETHRIYRATMDNQYGKVYKKEFGKIKRVVEGLSSQQIMDIMSGTFEDSIPVPVEHMKISTQSNIVLTEVQMGEYFGDVYVVLDKTQDAQVAEKQSYRMVVYETQQVRKASGIRPWNKLYFCYTDCDDELVSVIKKYSGELETELGYPVGFEKQTNASVWCADNLDCGGKLTIYNMD